MTRFSAGAALLAAAAMGCSNGEPSASTVPTEQSGGPREQTRPSANDKKPESRSTGPRYIPNAAQQELPTSLAAALNRSWYVVSGTLGSPVTEAETLVPVGGLDDVYFRYTWKHVSFIPDGVIADTVVDILKGLAPSPKSYPFVDDAAALSEVGFLYGPYDTAHEDGTTNNDWRLSPAFLQTVREEPAAFLAGTRVVLFVRADQLGNLGTIYRVVQALPFDGENIDASSLEDNSSVPVSALADLAEDAYADQESMYQGAAERQLNENEQAPPGTGEAE